MAVANVYLNFMGKTEEAFNFYKSVFGGDFLVLQRFKETPHGDQMSPADKEKVMHVALPVGKGTMLMGTDTLESMGQTLTVGNNVHIALEADSEAEAKKLFDGLSAGGTVTMPLEKVFWGAYFGMFTDKFGISWMVNHTYAKH
jgi:PhnB protein